MHETRTAWTTAANPEKSSVTNNIPCEIAERFVLGVAAVRSRKKKEARSRKEKKARSRAQKAERSGWGT
jgi:hypothetical protein